MPYFPELMPDEKRRLEAFSDRNARRFKRALRLQRLRLWISRLFRGQR